MTGPRVSRGFTLLEVLLVIAVVAMLAAAVIPRADPLGQDQLLSAGQAVSGDLAYARSLAVANNSKYKLTFDLAGNRYILTHSGVNVSLNTLPRTAWTRSEDPATQQTTDLDEVPHIGPPPKLLAVGVYTSSSASPISEVEFGPLGELTQGTDVVVWLTVTTRNGQGYLPLAINAVTGLTTVGQYSSYGPPASLLATH